MTDSNYVIANNENDKDNNVEIDLIVKDTALIEYSNNNIVEISEVVKIDQIFFSKENIKENNMIVEKMMIMTWILH